ncbi:interleukin-17C [Melanerpes formicivorus]|uniref:interleukin-17C n=1 Tax=Melanerpes formicivorus TaxID=211600 RepID=UPI00358E4363
MGKLGQVWLVMGRRDSKAKISGLESRREGSSSDSVGRRKGNQSWSFQVWFNALALLGTLALCHGLRRPTSHQHQPHSHCYSTSELQDGAAPAHLLGLRWDHYLPVQLVPQLERLQEVTNGHRRHRRHRHRACPALQLRAGLRSEPNERSISPWRYRIDEDQHRHPPKLAFAECLCSGCIDVKTGRETTSLNSVAIHQNMMVLRRKPCPRPAAHGLVTFEVDYIRVPVGCTCVLPRTAR